MDNVKNLLLVKRKEISTTLDVFIDNIKNILKQKNEKIVLLTEEISELKSKKTKKSGKSKNVDIFELKKTKMNNCFLKKILKKEIIIKKQRKEIMNLKTETSQKSIIDTKDMTAFKLVAIELDEKEKVIKNNIMNINNLEKEIENLNNIISNYERKIEDFELKVKKVEDENIKLQEYNNLQQKTIETITTELNNKKNKIEELRDYYMDILNDYNDILLRIE